MVDRLEVHAQKVARKVKAGYPGRGERAPHQVVQRRYGRRCGRDGHRVRGNEGLRIGPERNIVDCMTIRVNRVPGGTTAASGLLMATPRPLRLQVVEILRNAITECVFEPGGKLVERELCEQLGVSRTTLREALRQLEAEGLLVLTPNKGPAVASLDAGGAADAYALRAELEGYACAECAKRVTPADLADLRTDLVAMTRAVAAGDFNALQHAKTTFYDRLYDIAGNAELKRVLRLLRARVTLIRGLDVDRAARMRETVDGAKAIMEALARRSPAAARKAAEEHIRRAAALAIGALGITSSARSRRASVG
ncbi:MAG: GntR family transcriptional regulator [Proteobacteria bacterium]|nr:GntR family transcriptional regulator [Pseudomonadota bacterium]